MSSQPLRGPLATPSEASPRADPRIDPRMLAAATKLGLDMTMPAPSLSSDTANLKDMIEFVHDSGNALENIHHLLVDAEDGSGVLYSLEHAENPDDGFRIDLHVHRPIDQGDRDLPAVAIIHGGAQVMFGAYSPLYRKWAHDLARRGLIAINVAYRNGVGENKEHNPFPTGLNDCIAAVHWITKNRTRLRLSKLIIQGESGGANLSVATTMKLLRDGHDKVIHGIYAMSPYVSGAYAKGDEWKVNNDLSSLVDCDGYLLNSAAMSIFVTVYDPSGENEQNPLAWPLRGGKEDFAGFPPTVVSVDELDPLRDEGIALARKMSDAGVRLSGSVKIGMMHGAAIWQKLLPDQNSSTIGDIKRFAEWI